ncbi:HEPN domain-containing protein [Thermomicrobium sp. CFH 73360]|uniref:HEPN domain-containing protein n=1 Tax=Thermomicrobium sp. CFH 73360 TaxID=2951987 RepID=UPI002076DBEF|nr:HEPN domain-containing protein [Thermomicrobium sp. CFH 73360]MCM8746279.1 HEPN domain-containing protein [Thermomicrobium sp. CFH 73360]
MSVEKRRQEATRWLRQAADDLEAAQALYDANKFAQACFFAQQAAEKALKALWYALDLDPWGHSVTRLIDELPEEFRRSLSSHRDAALALDKLYVPTRYPDALGVLTPAEAYTRAEAERAVSDAWAILIAVREMLA